MAFLRQKFSKHPGDEEKEQEKNMESLELKKEISNLKQFVNQLQDERLKETPVLKEKKEIKLGIQMLICSYLGVFDSIPKMRNEKKAILLSQILNTDGHENIRKRLSSIDALDSNNVRRKNLTYIHDLFEKLELHDAAKLVKSDLNKIPRNIEK